jgi:hypothetical protein
MSQNTKDQSKDQKHNKEASKVDDMKTKEQHLAKEKAKHEEKKQNDQAK